jgi:hypothetical protein
MCWSYITYLICPNCDAILPGSRGYYNIREHSPPCKMNCLGYYDHIGEPPESVQDLVGGSGRVQGAGKMADCLECYIFAREEEREMEAEKAKKEKVKK